MVAGSAASITTTASGVAWMRRPNGLCCPHFIRAAIRLGTDGSLVGFTQYY